MNILVVIAHPDDETLGMGATIAKLAAEGHEVRVGVLADGLSSRNDWTADEKAARVLAFQQACKSLGARPCGMADLPDQWLDTMATLALTQHITRWLEATKAEAAYTHSGKDLNQDHVAVHRATLIATRPTPGCTVREVYAFETPSATDYACGQWGQFAPSVFVDVTGFMDQKLAALRCYEVEMREFPHPRSEEAVKATAQRWGSVAGVQAAEAFECVRRMG